MNVKNYLSVSVYHLFFLEEDSRKKALERGPWCFENYLFIIKPWGYAMEALGFDFKSLLMACVFTFHISYLPPQQQLTNYRPTNRLVIVRRKIIIDRNSQSQYFDR